MASALDEGLSDWDRAFSYHPMPVEIAKAEGVWITDAEGRRFIDATGGAFRGYSWTRTSSSR